jgi:uncharacterized protein
MPVRLDTEFGVAHGASVIWDRLHDVEFVATCFPGAELESVQPDGGYAGVIRLRLGPTTARFRGVMHVSYDEGQQTATITARGDDARRTKASATATLAVTAAGDGNARVEVEAEIEVVGSLAQFAQSGGVEVTRLLLRDFAAAMEQRLDNEAPATGAAPEPVESAAAGAGAAAPIGGWHLIWRLMVERVARLGRHHADASATKAVFTKGREDMP